VLPDNPFDDSLFLPVVLRVLLLLAVGFVAVVVAERKPLRVLRRSTLFLRLRTWLWVAPVYLLALFVSGFLAFALAVFVTLQAVSEYVRLVGISRRYALLLMLWSVFGLVIGAVARSYFLFLPFGFFIVVTLIPILSGQVEGAARQVAGTLFGYAYIGLPMGFLAFVKTGQPWGVEFLLIVGIAVALSDVTAFTFGSAVRTRTLTARVSGGKTWSATLGNLAGAGIAVALLLVAVPDTWTTAGVIALACAIALGCIWGDLTGGFLKRDFAVKDTGSLLFGFGGILERVDSLLFALPLGYYALLLANSLAS
jgi:phosphatidate cytidylyltransferase